MKCPKCKSTNYTKLVKYGVSVITYVFRCQKCGHKWKGIG